MHNDDVVEQEQKTYDSSPATPEELRAVKDGLYDADISGGLQNIQVPEDELVKMRDQDERAKSFIIMQNTPDSCDIPHRIDGVNVTLTPEELVILVEVLEKYSLKMQTIDYASDVMKMDSLYKQQALVRGLRDTINHTLDEYIRIRPYTPFLSSWVKRIGKENVRKMQD